MQKYIDGQIIEVNGVPTRATFIEEDILDNFTVITRGVDEDVEFSVKGKKYDVLKFLNINEQLSFREQLEQSRRVAFGNEFGKWLKEKDIEGQIRRAAKQGYTGLVFDLKESRNDPTFYTDPLFERAIKSKFGNEFKVKRDRSTMQLLGQDTIFKNNKLSIDWSGK